jgi:hypothetical protein
MDAAYNPKDLITACCGGISQVTVLGKAQKCAQDDFGLNTQKAVLDFICNDGLENLQYINTKPWELNPDPTLILVDAYGFYSGQKQGYIAFFFSTKTNKWLIKSFKLNKDSMPRNSMADKLLALGFDQKQLRNMI